MDYFLYYQLIISAILLIILINFIINNVVYRSPSGYKLSKDILKENPLVSVLIPARNEENNIGRCLRSLVKQDYHNIEILVLDDNSIDNTGVIVSSWAGRDGRVKLITGKHLIKGWKGKSYACHQLSLEAKGRYLIFTDADTLHFPYSVSSAVAALEANNLDALSVFPRQIMVSVHERLVVVFINIAVLALMPIILIKKMRSPKLCIANGQFILFKRETYDSIGGHRNIRKDIVEDVAISKQVKKHGFRFMIFDGRQSIHCRMYNGVSEVIGGFSKFIFAAMNYSIASLASVIFFVLLLFLAPIIFLLFGLFLEDWPLLININLILQVSVIFIIRVVMTFRFRSRIIDIVLHPLSMFYITILSINSVYQARFGKGIYWKDRVYTINDEEELDRQEQDT